MILDIYNCHLHLKKRRKKTLYLNNAQKYFSTYFKDIFILHKFLYTICMLGGLSLRMVNRHAKITHEKNVLSHFHVPQSEHVKQNRIIFHPGYAQTIFIKVFFNKKRISYLFLLNKLCSCIFGCLDLFFSISVVNY